MTDAAAATGRRLGGFSLPVTAPGMPPRQPHIDALKLIGAQLIVLHHLSAYGPLADAAAQAAPALMAWLYDYARMAVQLFLVLGGYLAMQGLQDRSLPLQAGPGALLRCVGRRYLRLALPLLVALGLAVASAALARQWLPSDFVPGAPTWGQLLAHALLLHDVLGAEALSAGVWYVAIDLQLYALLALLLWLGWRTQPTAALPALSLALLLALLLASLFHFNRDAGWDSWALYFFGSYGLGAAVFLAGRACRPLVWLGLLATVGLLALALDWRTRIALALAVALLLGLAERYGPRVPDRLVQLLQTQGRSSYALFLIHFPVLLLGNALYARLGLSGPLPGVALLLACWAASVALAAVFERRVEGPLNRWVSSKRRA